MLEHERLILSYVHLDKEQRADAALHMLRKVASLVKPIMRNRGWKVGQLAEFYPSEPSLLGLNVGLGQKICLRLRHPTDRTTFLPLDNVVDTMLHELSHIEHGPHDAKFHALWDQLRDKMQGLLLKGYTGEGFLSEGRRLGGSRLPEYEAWRVARQAAGRQQAGPPTAIAGYRLGGLAPRPGDDLRKVMADAAERRNKVLRGCGTERFTSGEMEEIANTATRNGFRTQAEEDEANEAVINQALWELAQEAKRREREESAGFPADTGRTATAASLTPGSRRISKATSALPRGGKVTGVESMWECGRCTLQNPAAFLCCDACGAEFTASARKMPPNDAAGPGRRQVTATTVDLTKSPTRQASSSKGRAAAAVALAPLSWSCRFCSTRMDRQWWTCATCGMMKESGQ